MMFGWKNQFSKVEAGVDPDFDDMPPIRKKDCKSAELLHTPTIEVGIPICYGAWQRVECEIMADANGIENEIEQKRLRWKL